MELHFRNQGEGEEAQGEGAGEEEEGGGEGERPGLLVLSDGVGQGCPGLSASPLPWCACPARGGTVRQSYHTRCVTSLQSNTALPGCVVPVGAWTHGKRAGRTTGSQHTQVLWGIVSCACQGSHAFSGPVQLLQLKVCVPVVSG